MKGYVFKRKIEKRKREKTISLCDGLIFPPTLICIYRDIFICVFLLFKIKAITGTKPSRWWRVRAKGTRDATEAAELPVPPLVERVEELAVMCPDQIENQPATATKTSAVLFVKRRRRMTPIQR